MYLAGVTARRWLVNYHLHVHKLYVTGERCDNDRQNKTSSPPHHQLLFGSALVATTPAIPAPRVDPSSGGTFPVSTYLVSHDFANAKSPFSRPCNAMIPSMDAPAPPAFLSVSFHTRMTSRKREQDCRTSVTPMASDVSCNETANKDNLETSLFHLLEHITRKIYEQRACGRRRARTEWKDATAGEK